MPPSSQRDRLIGLLEGRNKVGNRFTKLQRLGDGGAAGTFSALLTALDDTTGERVALKFLLPSFADSYRDDSFGREAALLADLHGKPDIIQLACPRAEFTETLHSDQGISLDVSFSYYALELARTDVGAVIANCEWDAEESLLGFRSMCRAVQRLHSLNIVHRDLKPPNFLVIGKDIVKAADFGAARRLDGVTPALATYAGPPGDIRYSAPELLAIVHDEWPHVAFCSDFFSLGAILFELFSGTILTSHLYDPGFVGSFMQAAAAVKVGQRRHVVEHIVTAISDARPIPSVTTFGAPSLPPSIRQHIDGLVGLLAALDYRKRLKDFSSVFNRINTCLLILRNENKYQRWLAEKRRRRNISLLTAARSLV